jgi:alkylation response protein AidB-like acyl-CoA dehydrogenase
MTESWRRIGAVAANPRRTAPRRPARRLSQPRRLYEGTTQIQQLIIAREMRNQMER